jgi:hypothetical protein
MNHPRRLLTRHFRPTAVHDMALVRILGLPPHRLVLLRPLLRLSTRLLLCRPARLPKAPLPNTRALAKQFLLGGVSCY